MATYVPFFDPNTWYHIIYVPDGSTICAYLNTPSPPGVWTCAPDSADISQQFQVMIVPGSLPEQPVFLLRNHLAGSDNYLQAECDEVDCDYNTVALFNPGNLTEIETISKWTFIPWGANDGTSRMRNAAKGSQFVLDNSDSYIHMTNNLSNPATGKFKYKSLGQIEDSAFELPSSVRLTSPRKTWRTADISQASSGIGASTKAAIALSVLVVCLLAFLGGRLFTKWLVRRRQHPKVSDNTHKRSWMLCTSRVFDFDTRRNRELPSDSGHARDWSSRPEIVDSQWRPELGHGMHAPVPELPC